MFQSQVVSFNNEAYLKVTPEMMKTMGVKVGDLVDVDLVDRQALLRATDETARHEKVMTAAREIMQRRKKLFEGLAEGAP